MRPPGRPKTTAGRDAGDSGGDGDQRRASEMLMFFVALLIVLLVGDAASTFLYHVPQHIWGRLHLRTHHDRSRSYWDHAVLSKDPEILLDGFLGALPYLVIAAFLWPISGWAAAGAATGLILGQIHVWWRHMTDLGWRTPPWVVRLARLGSVVLPEDHDGHHRNPDIEFGDIFRFYDAPARAFLTYARSWQRRRRNAMRRLQRIKALRLVRNAQRA